MQKIEIVASDERLITPSGLSLVGQVLGKSDMIRKANRMRTEKRSQPQIGTGDILLTMIGLLTLGKSDFENVNEFHSDEEFYTLSLGLRSGIPSESSLRNRLDAIGTSMNTQILEGNINMFRECGFKPTALNCGCVPIIPVVIRRAFPGLTKMLTGMRRYLHISEPKDICATLNFARAVSIASVEHQNFSLKQYLR